LAVEVHAKPTEAGHAVGEVGLTVLGQVVRLLRRQELGHDALELPGRARLRGHCFEMSVNPDVRRRSDLQVEVGTSALEQVMQELGQVGHDSSSGTVREESVEGASPLRISLE
jgi:hypothetical protein